MANAVTPWMVRPGLRFKAAVEAPPGAPSALWLAFQGGSLLVSMRDASVGLPHGSDLSSLGLKPVRTQFLGRIDDLPCFSAEIEAGAAAPEGWSLVGLRTLFGTLGDDFFRIAGRASQIVDWDRDNRFCGRCRTPMISKTRERAKECPACGLVAYPRISPAVIVAVVRGSRLLLARAARFPKSLFSVLAGFVDAGETLEECVVREVREEVGIEVTGLRYFTSQPWPFPNSLMVAFTAAHASGEIAIDGEEIVEADWYSADALPERIPDRISVARKLIDWFRGGAA